MKMKNYEKCTFRSSPSEVFLGKGALKICSKFTADHPCRSMISVKLQGNFIEITLWHGCSPFNLLHIFRTPFYKNTSGVLLLHIIVAKTAKNLGHVVEKCLCSEEFVQGDGLFLRSSFSFLIYASLLGGSQLSPIMQSFRVTMFEISNRLCHGTVSSSHSPVHQQPLYNDSNYWYNVLALKTPQLLCLLRS